MRNALKVLGLGVVTLLALSSASLAQVPVGNHYLCHKVGDNKVPAKFVPVVGVSAVDPVGAFTVDLKKPFLLCQPTAKNGSPIINPLLNYCCYKAKSATKVKANFNITDQFGALQLGTKKPFLLCNPCSVAPAP